MTETLTLPMSENLGLSIISDDEDYLFLAGDHTIGRATVYGLAAEGQRHNSFTGALFAIYAEDGKAVFLDGITMKSKTDGDK